MGLAISEAVKECVQCDWGGEAVLAYLGGGVMDGCLCVLGGW